VIKPLDEFVYVVTVAEGIILSLLCSSNKQWR